MTATIKPAAVVPAKDKFAKLNGLFWEARFNHPKIGQVVLLFATRQEASEATLKA